MSSVKFTQSEVDKMSVDEQWKLLLPPIARSKTPITVRLFQENEMQKIIEEKIGDEKRLEDSCLMSIIDEFQDILSDTKGYFHLKTAVDNIIKGPLGRIFVPANKKEKEIVRFYNFVSEKEIDMELYKDDESDAEINLRGYCEHFFDGILQAVCNDTRCKFNILYFFSMYNNI